MPQLDRAGLEMSASWIKQDVPVRFLAKELAE
jgi:hypothetical protein